MSPVDVDNVIVQDYQESNAASQEQAIARGNDIFICSYYLTYFNCLD